MKDDMTPQTLNHLQLELTKAYKNRIESRRLLQEAQAKWEEAVTAEANRVKLHVVPQRSPNLLRTPYWPSYDHHTKDAKPTAHTTRKPFRKFETVPASGAFTRHGNGEGEVLYVSVYYRNAGNNGGAYQLVGVSKDLTGNIDNIRSANELLYVLGHLEYLRKLTGYRLNASLDADKIKAVKDFREGEYA